MSLSKKRAEKTQAWGEEEREAKEHMKCTLQVLEHL
jgi:hypothetical protein